MNEQLASAMVDLASKRRGDIIDINAALAAAGSRRSSFVLRNAPAVIGQKNGTLLVQVDRGKDFDYATYATAAEAVAALVTAFAGTTVQLPMQQAQFTEALARFA